MCCITLHPVAVTTLRYYPYPARYVVTPPPPSPRNISTHVYLARTHAYGFNLQNVSTQRFSGGGFVVVVCGWTPPNGWICGPGACIRPSDRPHTAPTPCTLQGSIGLGYPPPHSSSSSVEASYKSSTTTSSASRAATIPSPKGSEWALASWEAIFGTWEGGAKP